VGLLLKGGTERRGEERGGERTEDEERGGKGIKGREGDKRERRGGREFVL